MQRFQLRCRLALASDRCELVWLERVVPAPEASRLSGVPVPTPDIWLFRSRGWAFLKFGERARCWRLALLDWMAERARCNTTRPELGHG